MVSNGHLFIAISGNSGAGTVEVARQAAARQECNHLDKEQTMTAAELLGDSLLIQEQVDEAARAVMPGSGISPLSKPPAMRGEPFPLLSVDDIAHLTAQLAL